VSYEFYFIYRIIRSRLPTPGGRSSVWHRVRAGIAEWGELRRVVHLPAGEVRMSPPSPLLDEAAVRERLRDHPTWHLTADGWLECELTFKNFNRAVLFVNAIAYL